jgi:hypothetical protein
MSWDRKLPPAAQLPGGLAGMVNHENRLLSEPTELLTASGVALDDLHIRKEPGAAAYDTTGLANAPALSGSYPGATQWAGFIASFPGSGLATVGTTASGTMLGGGVTFSTLVVPAGGWAAGSLVVMAIVNVSTPDPNSHIVTLTDSAGNTWTIVADVSLTYKRFNFGNTQLAYSLLAATLNAGDIVSLTRSPGDVTSTFVAGAFSGVTSGVHTQSFATNGSTAATLVGPLSAPGAAPYLLVAAIGNGGAAAHTPGASFTERIEVVPVALNYRIDTMASTIIGLFDWYSDAETTPAGTVSTTAGSTTVNGVGTTFTAHAPGDRIVVANETRIIATITSATVLDTTTAWVTTNAGAAYKIRVGNRIITATTGGNLFKEKPLTLTTGDLDAVTLKSGLSLSARPGRFVAGGKEAAAVNRKLFYFNGVDPVQVLSGDGTTTSNIATPPADWSATADQGKQPINGLIHENRLVAWGNLNDPHRAYASDPDDHENFTSAAALSMRFRSDVGDRIWCGASFQGVFFAFKYPRGIFYLDDTDTNTGNWLIRTKSEAVGVAPSPYAALPIDDDVIFMAADGTFHLLSAVDALGGTRASDLTRRLGLSKWTRENLNLARLNQVLSVWYPQKKLAAFTVPSAGSASNDLTLKFDFSGVERDLPLKFSYSSRDVGDGLAIRRSPAGGPETPILGETSFAYLLDQEARNKNGAPYTGQYQVPHLDFSHLDPSLRWRRKHFEHLAMLMEPVSAGTLTVEVFVDGVLKQTLTFDATRRRHKQKLNVGDGYTISIQVTNSVLNEDFKVLSHMVWFKVGNEDENRGAA